LARRPKQPKGKGREHKGGLQRRVELELAILVIAVVFLLKFVKPFSNLIKTFELKTVDMRFDLRGERPAPDDVVIVRIDDSSMSRLGQWPWPRKYHGQLVERLEQLGAKAVVFDVLFIEPSRLGPEDDGYFAKAIERAGNVFLPIYNAEEIPGLNSELVSSQVPESFIYPTNLYRKKRIVYPTVVAPLPLFAEKVQGSGTVSLPADVDGNYRHVALLVGRPDDPQRAYPHVALDVCRYVFGLPKEDVVVDAGGKVRLGHQMSIPVTGPQSATLYYYGKHQSMPQVSYADVFDDTKVSRSTFENRVAIVGWTATGLTDTRPSPMDPVRPGVAVNATMIDNILNGDFMVESPDWVSAIMVLLIGAIMGTIIIRLSPARGGMFTICFLLAYLFLSNFFFSNRAIIVEVISPTLVIFLAYASITAYRLGTEEKEKKRIRDTFGTYVTSQVVDELLQSPDKANLGGSRKEVSILFADVRGFTSLSEKMAPERVVEYLNDLFEPMNNIIFEHHGTIDNIIGDCLMAIFNAPLDQPDHVERCVRTGMAMITDMKRLQREWQAQGRPTLSIGVGINTGEVVVGNVGSASRKVYTVIGDDVNLAARLEALTRQYQVDIIIGEATYEAVKDIVRVRRLGEVVVKGKTKPVEIYELLAVDGSGVVEPGPTQQRPVDTEPQEHRNALQPSVSPPQSGSPQGGVGT